MDILNKYHKNNASFLAASLIFFGDVLHMGNMAADRAEQRLKMVEKIGKCLYNGRHNHPGNGEAKKKGKVNQ